MAPGNWDGGHSAMAMAYRARVCASQPGIRQAAGEPDGSLVMDVVTIYEDADFGGTGIFLDVGEYRLFGASDMNDTISSIQVPAGLVAMVFEDADSGGGYGISADFLEDCA